MGGLIYVRLQDSRDSHKLCEETPVPVEAMRRMSGGCGSTNKQTGRPAGCPSVAPEASLENVQMVAAVEMAVETITATTPFVGSFIDSSASSRTATSCIVYFRNLYFGNSGYS